MRHYQQMSGNQIAYLAYISDHPGCCIMDVVRACKRNPDAGHIWIYDGVHRLERQGVVRIEYRSDGRTKLYSNVEITQ